MKKWMISSVGTFLIVCTFFVYLRCERARRMEARVGTITKIAQTGPQKQALKTDALAQLLGLSIDKTTFAQTFDLREASLKLLKCPLIKDATVEMSSSDTLYIDYTLRQPYVWVSDGENLAMDRERYLFPFFPFFTPKKMTEFYLGLKAQNAVWNQAIDTSEVDLAFQILDLLKEELFFVVRIDVSAAADPSLGKREVVVILDKGQMRHYLRLTPKGYQEQLQHYLTLCKKGDYNQDLVMDLRVPHLAFIQKR